MNDGTIQIIGPKEIFKERYYQRLSKSITHCCKKIYSDIQY